MLLAACPCPVMSWKYAAAFDLLNSEYSNLLANPVRCPL